MHFATLCFPKQIHWLHCIDLHCNLLQSVYSIRWEIIFLAGGSDGKTGGLSMQSSFFELLSADRLQSSLSALYSDMSYKYFGSWGQCTKQESSCFHVFSSQFFGKDSVWQGCQCNHSLFIPDGWWCFWSMLSINEFS